MARLIYSAITSLDGYIEDEDGKFDWAEPDEEVHAFVNDLERQSGTYLYGRRMYEVMLAWETMNLADQPPHIGDFAEIWQVADKIVYSKTLETVSSARTRIERDFDPEAVRQLKAAAGHDITVGGPDLATQAFRAGLVDELHLFAHRGWRRQRVPPRQCPPGARVARRTPVRSWDGFPPLPHQTMRGGDAPGALQESDDFAGSGRSWMEKRQKGAQMPTEVSSESNADNRMLIGTCECGKVRYRVEDAFLYASNCHCSRCRAATGSAFKAFAGIEREKLEITDGRDGLLVVGEEDSNDTRCAACGSLLFSVVRDGAYVHVALGSLVDAPGIRPTKHIFVGSKAPWFEITDDLPQFEEHAR